VSAGYISKALALDPRHVKALWLLASYQTEKSDYRAALITWEKLAKLMPADSSDYRIISANMDEARSKLTGPQTMAAPPLSAAVLRGTVDIDAKFKGRVAPGATLFVFAKEAGAGGPPLAVIRTTVTVWPMSFSLDDSQAMIPTRTLSNFSKVVVEARISRSGNAQAGAGDLHVLSKIVDPHAPNKLQLVIRDEIT
jgi:cytochrome c-type biogenesis protein CcmH